MARSNSYRFLYIAVLAASVIFTSCGAYKKLPYLKNAENLTSEQLAATVGIHEAKVMPNDILSITVNSTIPGAATDYNLPLIPNSSNDAVQTTMTFSLTSGSLQNYIVDKDGKINFPVLGELKISGMTTSEVQDYIASLIYPKHITERPVVNVRFINFQVAVLGEVNRPGSYKSENGQMTIFDALAAAGDMTIYGKRDNVMLVRTKDNGEIGVHRINMQDENLILNKDLFYLQQNDKLYIEPNKAKGNNSRFGTFESVSLSALSIVISVAAILLK